ncbi:MAG: CAP domain-containing protein [Chitinophagaceae bacterium]|nr:MAG: CAP domain-containing protein [Chitinophagaceae bacterium]
MKTSFLLVPFLVFPFTFPVLPETRNTVASVSADRILPADPIVTDILTLTNKARAKKGLSALVMKDGLNRIAAGHSQNMATGKVPFSHDGFKERYSLAKKEYAGLNGFAENVSFGPSTGREVVDGWMGSKHHKENILGDYTSIGIGVATDKNGRNYYTQVFGKE